MQHTTPGLWLRARTLTLLALALAACGGGGATESDASVPAPDATSMLDGSAADGGVSVVSARIGPAGGTVAAGDGAFELVIPPDALAAETEITIRRLEEAAWPAGAASAAPLGGVYEIGPEGLAFAIHALAVHTFASRPAALGASGDPLVPVEHVMVSAEGTQEVADTSVLYRESGAVVAVGEIPHLSAHWLTPARSVAGGLTATIEGAPPAAEVGGQWRTSRFELSGTGTFHEVSIDLFSTDLAAVAPILDPGFAVDATPPPRTPGMPRPDLDLEEILRALFGLAIQGATRSARADVSLSAALAVEPPPGYACLEARSTSVGIGMGFGVRPTPSSPSIRLYRDAAFACSGSGPAPTAAFEVLPSLEGMFPFLASDLFSPAGLVPGREYVAAVNDSPSGGGIAVLDPVTGVVERNFIGVGSFDVVGYNDWGGHPVFAAASRAGVTLFGWNGEPAPSGPFGAASLGGVGTTTSIDIGDVEPSDLRRPLSVLYTNLSPPALAVVDASSVVIGRVPSSAMGGAVPVSFRFTPDRLHVFGATTDGAVWTGPWSPPGAPTPSPLTRVSAVVIDEPRFVRCFEASSDANVCVIAGYGDDTLYVFEVTDTSAVLTTTIPVGAEPVDPAVVSMGSDVLIAVGTGTETLELFRYTPATDAAARIGAPTAIPGCVRPNHVRFGAAGALWVSCFESGNLVRVASPITFVAG